MCNVHGTSFNQSNQKTHELQEIQTSSNSDHECVGLTQFPDCKELAPPAACWAAGQLAAGEMALFGNVLAGPLLTWAGICLRGHLDYCSF